MVTREDITWLYRCILGREPESEMAIDSNIKMFSNFDEARRTFLGSREFVFSIQKSLQGDVFYNSASLRPFVKPPNRFGLVTTVKNEVNRVQYMLNSALSLVDFVSLVDTGSTDGTLECAYDVLRRSGVRYDIRSIDFIDFSHARNTALSLLPKSIAWALVLDADEHIVQEDYQRFVDLADISDIDAWNLPDLTSQTARKNNR